MEFKDLKEKIVKILKNAYEVISEKMKTFKRYIKPKMTRKNVIIALIVAVVVVGSSSFIFGYYMSSKSTLLNKFERALLGDDPYKALKYMQLKGKGQLDKENGEPFIQFVKENKKRGKDFVNQLRYGDNNETNILRLKERKGLLFNSYYIEVKDVYINLSTNLKDTDIYINENFFYKVRENDFSQKFGPMVPGIYNLKGVYNGEYGKIENEVRATVLSSEESVNIQLKGMYLTLDGNYLEGIVYLNGANTEKTIRQFKDIGPIPSTSKVYAAKKFPWSSEEIKSEEKQINDHSKLVLNIDPMTEDVRKTLEENFKDFYKGFFEALSNGDKKYIKNTSDTIKDNLYKLYKKDSFIVSNSYSMDGLKWQKNAISIDHKDGKFTSRAIADIRYKEKTNLFVFNLNEVEVKKSFDTELTYDEKEDKWVITNVKEIK